MLLREGPQTLYEVRFWQILLQKSFFAMTENSQDRWCVSRAAM
jgi:hypothetical protein